ncbi:lambda-like phage minor tail protein L [Leptolyngbya sp. PCC 7375]|nr:lambda-like phage minor tail protein L [Leptolyngbya sp. PCC 7375]
MGAEVNRIQELSQDTFIDLFEVSGYNPESPFDKFRFANHVGVQFGGKAYQPLACSIETIEYTSEGQQPEVGLTVSDNGGIITDLILLYNNMEGAAVKVVRTQARYLDGQPQADPTAILAEADFIIIRRDQHTPGDAITFTLSNPIEVDGAKLPGRICLRTCIWVYRDPDTCGYTGSTRFTLSNQRTLNPALDKCAKSITACRLRFGNNAVLPFGGYPGLQRRS